MVQSSPELAGPRAPVAPPPELVADVLTEILLRVPPEEPADLFRAAVVCKPWRRIICDRAFSRRYREFHRRPPMLGFFGHKDIPHPQFTSITTASSFFRIPHSCRDRMVLDCRHGRVLFGIDTFFSQLTVWDPITKKHDYIFLPQHYYRSGLENCMHNAAVLCAVNGCDHLDCHGRPFHVVFIASKKQEQQHSMLYTARVYSSESRKWSEPTDFQHESILDLDLEIRPTLHAGDALYFILTFGLSILKYDLVGGHLSAIDMPGSAPASNYLIGLASLNIALTVENGILLSVILEGDGLFLRMCRTRLDSITKWTPRSVIDLKKLLPSDATSTSFRLDGFVENSSMLFLSTNVGIFTIELGSLRVRKVVDTEHRSCGVILPYMSFYIPGNDCPGGEQHMLLPGPADLCGQKPSKADCSTSGSPLEPSSMAALTTALLRIRSTPSARRTSRPVWKL